MLSCQGTCKDSVASVHGRNPQQAPDMTQLATIHQLLPPVRWTTISRLPSVTLALRTTYSHWQYSEPQRQQPEPSSRRTVLPEPRVGEQPMLGAHQEPWCSRIKDTQPASQETRLEETPCRCQPTVQGPPDVQISASHRDPDEIFCRVYDASSSSAACKPSPMRPSA